MNDNLKFLEQIDAQEEYPWVDSDGNEHDDLVRYYSANGCKIRNASTGEVYDDAVELYPCDTKYYETDITLRSSESINQEDTANDTGT